MPAARNLAFAALLAGCTSPQSTPTDAGPTVDLCACTPHPNPDLTPSPTQIEIAYPADCADITIRGANPPLDWNRDTPTRSAGPNHCIFETFDITQPTEWKPLWKGNWSRGANYHVTPGGHATASPHFTTPRGRVTRLFPAFQSNALGNTRPVWAYLPPSYDENPEARYPVLYMHDGQNLFDPKLAFGGNEWKVDEALDTGAEILDRAQSIREIIVIGPENTAARIDEYTPTRDATEMAGGRGDLYLKMLIDELKPAVDKALRTRPEQSTTGVMGSSLGGLISSYAGVRRPDVYRLIGAMSPSSWWDDRMIIKTVAASSRQAQRVYVDSGDSGPSMDDLADTKDLASAYRSIGYVEGVDFHYVVQPGAVHNEVYWAQRLPGALRFLFGNQDP